MAGEDVAEKITELEIRREAILTTLKDLKTAVDDAEVTREDYESSKSEYSEQLGEIDKELEEIKAAQVEEAPAEEEPVVEEEPAVEEAPAEEEPVVEEEPADYESMSWADLQRLASERGLQVVGKGVTKDKVIADLMALDRGETPAPAEEEPAAPAVEEVPEPVEEVKPVERVRREEPEEEVKEEVPIKREIEPTITARVEMLKGEIPALSSTLSSLATKLQVSKSSRDMIKKNKDEGLVDSTTYNNLKTKYDDEIKSIEDRIAEIEHELAAREDVIREYDNLVEFYEKNNKEAKSFEKTVLEKEMELNFMGSSKFYIVSNIKDHIAGILSDFESIEEELSKLGVSYPDESYIENRRDEIERENENLTELKTKISNFETLLKSLKKELKDEEVDEETYKLLKTEYTREKNRSVGRLGKIEGKVKMLKTEMKAYEKLEESLASCKSYIDMAIDSFKKIWLEDKINAVNAEINKEVGMIKEQEKEMSIKLAEMEKEVEKLLEALT